MSGIVSTVEFEPQVKKWLESYCKEQEMSFSGAMHQVLQLGIQVVEKGLSIEEMPKEQKLLIQCVMESLLILRESQSSEQRIAVGDRAKQIIRKTLGLG